MNPLQVDRLGHPRLLVFGDLMLDRYLWGEAERVSPEAPVLVLREETDEVRPGGAANVASFLRGLEADVVLAGVIGDDAEGRILQRLMTDIGVDLTGVITDPSRPTTTKQRFVGRSAQRQPHQILRVDRESRQPLPSDLLATLTESLLKLLPGCAAILISDYAKGACVPALIQSVIRAARDLKIPVLVDPCRGTDYQQYAGATLVKPNRVATELLFAAQFRDPVSIQQAAGLLRERLQLDAAVLTLDRDGMAYATANETGMISCPTQEVCDVTGAGDMVLAVLGLGYASGLPLIDSLHLANTAAGLEVQRFGVEPITRAEIAQELNRNQIASRHPLTLDELQIQVKAHRQAGRTIVFTNGCFDLLHVGHITLLEEAACLGDVLIVAINSDASVRKLKGETRSIISQTDRARMLSALACVDHVLIFEDDTPHRLLHAIRPDVLVKGGTTDHIVGREIVEAYGGRVARMSAVNGYSTTRIVDRLHSPVSSDVREST